MNSLKIVLLSSLMVGSSFATMPSLSTNSKNRIVTSALEGGMTGLALTGITAAVVNAIDPAPITKNEVKFWGITGAALTAAGAILGGVYEYFSLPEKHFSYAKQELSLISQDIVVGMLYQTKSEDWISTLKGQFCRSRFPLMNAFSYISAHYDKIVKISRSLNHALALESEDLRKEVQELQEYANTTMTLLQAVLSKITGEPNYTTECAAKAQEDAAFALSQAAIAQQARLANEWNREWNRPNRYTIENRYK